MESNYQYKNYITSYGWNVAILLPWVHHEQILRHNSSEVLDRPKVKLTADFKYSSSLLKVVQSLLVKFLHLNVFSETSDSTFIRMYC